MAAVIGTMAVAAFSIVMMTVMAAMGIGIKSQCPCGKGLCGFIGRSLHPRIQFDPGVSKRHLRAHSDAAADEGINLGSLQ